MITLIKHLWHTQRFALVAFLLALSVSGFFAARFVTSSIYWADPAHRNVQIEGWMSPGYVARSYRVPLEIIAASIGIDPAAPPPRRTLAAISVLQNKSLDTLRSDILEAVISARTTLEGPTR